MRPRCRRPHRGALRWCGLACVAVVAGCLGAAHTRTVGATGVGGAPSALRDSSLPVPFDLQEGVERANILGTNLFLLDVATARASSALAERIGSPGQGGIGHYLALMGEDDEGQPDGSVQVLFFTNDEVPQLAYRVHVGGSGRRAPEIREQRPPGVVHEPLMTLLNARWLALDAVPRTTQVQSTVLLPQRSGRIAVYVLAAARQPNVAVLGRHYRVDVAEDGAAVDSIQELSNAELELPTRDRTGQRLESLAITERDAEHPTEAHVLASRLANVPIQVTTGRGRWLVGAGGIDYLGPL